MHGLVGRLQLQQREEDWVKERKKGLVNREKGRGNNKHQVDFGNFSISLHISYLHWESMSGQFSDMGQLRGTQLKQCIVSLKNSLVFN